MVFEGFGNVATPPSNATDARLSLAVDSSAGLLLSGAYTDLVVTFVFGCSFLHNAIGISSPMENGNMLDISTSYFYTNGYAIRSVHCDHTPCGTCGVAAPFRTTGRTGGSMRLKGYFGQQIFNEPYSGCEQLQRRRQFVERKTRWIS